METLLEAIDRLERAGYSAQLRACPGGFREVRSGRIHLPEALIVDEIVRFEGESDPGDEAVVFALRTRDGSLRGTFVSTYGPGSDPQSGELIKRLDTARPTPESD
ncbi:MAG TPA: hypothetical protein VKH41_02810 [Myxococcota bacterium]|nr:hypothetical protein [Myxococcota bacterium]